MHPKQILFLDDDKDRHMYMTVLHPHDCVMHAYDIDVFRTILRLHIDPFDIISLDYDLNDFDDHRSMFLDEYATGLDACGYLVQHRDKLPPVIDIHSSNEDGAREMMAFLRTKRIASVWNEFDDLAALNYRLKMKGKP